MVCTSQFSPSLIHGLCAFFASNSGFMRLFQSALDTPLDSPFSATLSVHGLHFTVCAPSKFLGIFFAKIKGGGNSKESSIKNRGETKG